MNDAPDLLVVGAGPVASIIAQKAAVLIRS